MNRLVIIGNGFDLAHGYKTSYSDFLLWYLKKAIEKCSHCAIYKDELIQLKIPDYSATPSNFEKILNCDKLSELLELITPGRDMLIKEFRKSVLFQRLWDNAIFGNWIDIERNYFIEIRRIANQYNDSKTHNDTLKTHLILLNKQMACLRTELIEYLTPLDRISLDKVLSQTEHILFGDYLIDDFNSVEDLEHLNMKNSSLNNRLTHILNFNYTNTIKSYMISERFNDQTTINSIHGNLFDPNSVVFGFGDEMDEVYDQIEKLNENEFFKFVKSFYYLKTDNYRKLQRFIDAEKFQVYVMGHSCGLSDRTLLNSIFEHENCRSIKLFYHDQGEGKNDFTEKTHEISRHFKDKAGMRLKIVPFELSEPLPNYKPEQNE